MGSAICNHVSYNMYNTDLKRLKVMILLNTLHTTRHHRNTNSTPQYIQAACKNLKIIECHKMSRPYLCPDARTSAVRALQEGRYATPKRRVLISGWKSSTRPSQSLESPKWIEKVTVSECGSREGGEREEGRRGCVEHAT